jgi:hypothetical protein
MSSGAGGGREAARVMLGHTGALGVRLDPVIELEPNRPATPHLPSARSAPLELTGKCSNLAGSVPCTITWVVERVIDGVAETLEREDPRNGTLWLQATGPHTYQVMIASKEWSPLSHKAAPPGMTWTPLGDVDAYAIGLLGIGKLGYRIQPNTPVVGGELAPNSAYRFANAIHFSAQRSARIGELVDIAPTACPPWIYDLRLTINNSDAKHAGGTWQYRGVKPDEPLRWRFGCQPADPAETPSLSGDTVTAFAYCDHVETDGILNYGVMLDVLDKPGKPGTKPKVLTSVAIPNRWSGPVPTLESFRLDQTIDAGVRKLAVSARFSGFHQSIEVPLVIELWAARDRGRPRPANQLLSRHAERRSWTISAKHTKDAPGVHLLSAVLLEAPVAEQSDPDPTWRVYAEMRLSWSGSPATAPPFCRVARFTGLSGSMHGVPWSDQTATGIASAPVALR